jgi:nucleoside-diphosphate-sugar epimerase
MVKTIIQFVGKGSFQNIPWPKDYINVETGDYITNITKAKNILDWKPEIDFEKGIAMTVNYYKKHILKYL